MAEEGKENFRITWAYVLWYNNLYKICLYMMEVYYMDSLY